MRKITSSDYCRLLMERKCSMTGASHREKAEMILTFAMPLSYNFEKDLAEIEEGADIVLFYVSKAEKTKKNCEMLAVLSKDKKKELIESLFDLANSGLFPKTESACKNEFKYIVLSKAEESEISNCAEKLAGIFAGEFNSEIWHTKALCREELIYRTATLVNLKNHGNVLLPEKILEMSASKTAVLTAYALANGIWEETVNREYKYTSMLSAAGKSFGRFCGFAGLVAAGLLIDADVPDIVIELLSAGETVGSIGGLLKLSDTYNHLKAASKEKSAAYNMKEIYQGKTREELLKAAEEAEENDDCDVYDTILYSESHMW